MGKLGTANILITAVQVPFSRGGAEILVDGLRRELEARDFCVDVVSLPYAVHPKKMLLRQLALWRALDLRSFSGKRVDLVIATKFPSYMIAHPNKTVWLVHQHRQLYDLYGSRFGDFTSDTEDEALRRLLVQADKQALAECRSVCTISENVSSRLERYLEVGSKPIPPPLPLGDRYRREGQENYILSVGRICSIKRVDLMVKAMPAVDGNIKLKIVGVPDEPSIDTYLRSEIDKHHLWDRVEFLGRVGDEELLSLYANALAVYYAPHDEDYGFVTLEAHASGKPVITATDSGGVLEFVSDEHNGLVVEPTCEAIAGACNRLFENSELYDRLSRNALESEQKTTWDDVIGELTRSLYEENARPREGHAKPPAEPLQTSESELSARSCASNS